MYMCGCDAVTLLRATWQDTKERDTHVCELWSGLRGCNALTLLRVIWQDKKEKLRKAVESITMAECTFQPQTNEGNVRKLLQSILDQDPSALNNMR